MVIGGFQLYYGLIFQTTAEEHLKQCYELNYLKNQNIKTSYILFDNEKQTIHLSIH